MAARPLLQTVVPLLVSSVVFWEQAVVMGLKLSDSLEILKNHFLLLELTPMRISLASFATPEQCHSKSQVRKHLVELTNTQTFSIFLMNI